MLVACLINDHFVVFIHGPHRLGRGAAVNLFIPVDSS